MPLGGDSLLAIFSLSRCLSPGALGSSRHGSSRCGGEDLLQPAWEPGVYLLRRTILC